LILAQAALSPSQAHNCIAPGITGRKEAMRTTKGYSNKMKARKDKTKRTREKNQHLESCSLVLISLQWYNYTLARGDV